MAGHQEHLEPGTRTTGFTLLVEVVERINELILVVFCTQACSKRLVSISY